MCLVYADWSGCLVLFLIVTKPNRSVNYRLADWHFVSDRVAGRIVLVIRAAGLVRLAIFAVSLLLQVARHGWLGFHAIQ
jgi:hypothetical protein